MQNHNKVLKRHFCDNSANYVVLLAIISEIIAIMERIIKMQDVSRGGIAGRHTCRVKKDEFRTSAEQNTAHTALISQGIVYLTVR